MSRRRNSRLGSAGDLQFRSTPLVGVPRDDADRSALIDELARRQSSFSMPDVFDSPAFFTPSRRRVVFDFPRKSYATRGRAVKLYGVGDSLSRLRVRVPRQVLYCVRRKVRRQVLFAFRKAGFGGSARKKHWNRSVTSQYRC